MSDQILTKEEENCLLEDARFGDLEELTQVFDEISKSYILSIKDEQNNTMIHMSAANNHLEVLKYLLGKLSSEEGVELVNRGNAEGNTALHWASVNGNFEIVKYLCEEFKADPFKKNAFQHDAIFEAEQNGKDEIETWFLNKFDIEPVNEDDEINIKISNNDVEVNTGKEIDEFQKTEFVDSELTQSAGDLSIKDE